LTGLHEEEEEHYSFAINGGENSNKQYIRRRGGVRTEDIESKKKI